MSSDLKGAVKIKGGVASKGEAVVANGVLRVTLVRTTPDPGYGESQIKCGVASKGEVVVENGALRVRVV